MKKKKTSRAKKIAFWLADAFVFLMIVVHRTGGYTVDNYYVNSNSWAPKPSDIYHIGSSNFGVLLEPFFLVCLFVMILYLVIALVLKIKDRVGDGYLKCKIAAYIAAFVSVTYKPTGDWDWFFALVVGFAAVVSEVVICDIE